VTKVLIQKEFFRYTHGLSVTEVDLCHVISNIKMSSSLLDKPLSTRIVHQKVGSGMTGLILVLDVVIFNPEASKFSTSLK
jgi:protein tyrosine phosphatase